MAKKKPEKPEQSAAGLDGKVQTTDQTDGVNNPEMEIAPNPASGIKEVEQPKAAINTKTAAEVVSNAQASGGSGMLRSGALVFSGSAGNIGTDVSATTHEAVPYRSGNRSGRRIDPITRKVDYLDAEVIKTKVYQAKPLSETDAKQGYPGNYFNEHAITQKANGGLPAEPLYERSADEIDIDMLYYADGQKVKKKDKGNISVRSWNGTDYDVNAVEIQVGNFLARSLEFTVNNAGEITNFQVDETDCSVNNTDEAVARLASDAHLREMNQREIDRNVMISKAGNESDPSWSPLGDVVIDPSDQNRLLAFIEGLAGDHVYVSRFKTRTALAYQLNKVAKDGSRITGPMAEMVNGNIPLFGYGAEGTVSELLGRSRAFSKTAYKAGGAGLWLALNDSLPKYTTKGKMLSLPLSFKSVLGIVDSNADPLRVHQLLVDELQHNELFSTIDGPYDPLKPIVVTDKCAIINPISMMTGCTFNAEQHNLDTTIYVMHYENLRNRYNIRIRNYFMEAIFRWISERGQRIFEACKEGAETSVTINIPIVSSTTSLSLWDLIVLSATPYMIEARLTTMTELLKYEKNFGYPYTGLSAFKDVKDTSCDNYSLSDVESPISTAIAKPIAAMKVVMPELFWPVRRAAVEASLNGYAEGVGAWVVLPHYFNQAQFKYSTDDRDTRELLLDPEGYASMSYPSTRSGNNISYFDTVYGMSEEDYRLSLDRMVVYPAYQRFENKFFRMPDDSANGATADAATYKYGLVSDGIPVLPYFAYATDEDDKQYVLTVKDILSTPREVGICQVAPAGVLSPIQNGANSLNTVALDSSFLALSGPGFRMKTYHAVGTTQVHTILQAGSTNFDNSASLKYEWSSIYANPYSINHQTTGLVINAQASKMVVPYVGGSYQADYGAYDAAKGIYTGNEKQIDSDHDMNNAELYTLQGYFWTRLQRLPFVVNPFDCNSASLDTRSDLNINSYDVYDLMYIFGFEGFRTSDYSELIYERSKQRIAQGMNYTHDPFLEKSMLLK